MATMFCYLFYYTGRQVWGFVVPDLQADLGLSNKDIGWIAGAMLGTYGIGQFVNGNLGDKYGGRRMMTLGAISSVILVWATSFGYSFWTILIPWALNGYVQSLGWAPGSRLISNWWGPNERAKAFGYYMMAAASSTVLTFALCILVLQYMDWQWVFRLPVLLLLVGGVLFYIIARDNPQELGYDSPNPPQDGQVQDAHEEGTLERYKATLSNWRFLVACISLGFESMARYGLMIWVPAYYLGSDWRSNPSTAWVTLALPIGMAFGAISGGYLSDKIFHSNRSRPIVIMMLLAALMSIGLYIAPKDQPYIAIALLFMAGFFVYGPQASFWALCPDLLGPKRAGTGVGVMDATAYAFAAIQAPLFGLIIDNWGDTYGFVATATVCILSAITILFVRR